MLYNYIYVEFDLISYAGNVVIAKCISTKSDGKNIKKE